MPNLPPPDSEKIKSLEAIVRLVHEILKKDKIVFGHMLENHSKRLFFHSIALVAEIIGTFLVFLETLKIENRLPAHGLKLDDTGVYQSLLFHSAGLGFFLLFTGVILQGLVLYLEHCDIHKANKTLLELQTLLEPTERQ